MGKERELQIVGCIHPELEDRTQWNQVCEGKGCQAVWAGEVLGVVFFGLESLTQLTSSRIIPVLLTARRYRGHHPQEKMQTPFLSFSSLLLSGALLWILIQTKDAYSNHLLHVSHPGPHSLCINTLNASHSHWIQLYKANTSVPNLERRK